MKAVRTLVISQYDEPMEIISWQRAFCLLASGRARLEHEHDDAVVRTGSQHRRFDTIDSTCVASDARHAIYRVPSVLRVVTSIAGKQRPVRYSRYNVYARDDFTCVYCDQRADNTRRLTIDHVIPRSRGGRTSFENCATSCNACNLVKANRTPAEAGMPLLRRPYRPRWALSVVLAMHSKDVPESWRPFLQRA